MRTLGPRWDDPPVRGRLPWVALALALGCNAILGIEDRVAILCEEGSQCPSGFCTAEFSCDDTQWVLRFGGEGDDVALDVLHVDEDREGPDPGMTVVVGSFEDDISFGEDVRFESEGGRDAFVLALDPMGGVLWARQFSGPGDQVATAVDVGANGDLYVAGTFDRDTDFAGIDIEATDDVFAGYAVKLDRDGDMEWVAPFGATDGVQVSDVAFVETGVAVVGSYVGTALNTAALPVAERQTFAWISVTDDGELAAASGLSTTETSHTCCVEMSDAFGVPVLAGDFSGTIINSDPPKIATGVADGWITEPSYSDGDFIGLELIQTGSPITAMALKGTRIVTGHRLEEAGVVTTPQLAVVRGEYPDWDDSQIIRADDPTEAGRVVTVLTTDADETYAFGQFDGELRFLDGPGFDVSHQSVFVAVMDPEFLLPTGRTRAFSGEGDVSAGGMSIEPGGNVILAGGFEKVFALENDFGAPTLESAGGADIYVASLEL